VTGVDFHTFADADALAEALAGFVATHLRRSLAVSGGRTPARFFERLSRRQLDWPAITVTLVDERWVPETSDRSNAALLRRHLLTNSARAAVFAPLYNGAPSPRDACAHVAAALRPLRPFDVIVLGMGDDGHAASWFPHAPGLGNLLDSHRHDTVLPAVDGNGEARLTLTLPAVLEAKALALHIEGEGKQRILAKALEEGPVEDMPVRAILRARPALPVFWCP
jgi:6-phosphogluconolactonase